MQMASLAAYNRLLPAGLSYNEDSIEKVFTTVMMPKLYELVEKRTTEANSEYGIAV